MATTLMIENVNNDFSVYSSGRSEVPSNGSYYKFYQSKLRQLVTQTRHRKEQEARLARQRQLKTPGQENRLSEQRFHREYMNQIRQRSKMQSQESLASKIDDQRKNADSVLSNSSRIITLSIVSTSFESRPKSTIKPKQTPIPPKQPRIISAPTPAPRNLPNPRIIPTIKIDCVEETLSKANIHSFTQVSSSSSQYPNNQTSQHAHRSIMDAIMFHLTSHIPADIPIGLTYEDIAQKFSSSISPTVYEDFERIAAWE